MIFTWLLLLFFLFFGWIIHCQFVMSKKKEKEINDEKMKVAIFQDKISKMII